MGRSSSEEVALLEKENEQLRINNEILKSEMEGFKAEMRKMSDSLVEIKRNMLVPQSQEDLQQTAKVQMVRQVSKMDTEDDSCLNKKALTKGKGRSATTGKTKNEIEGEDLPENMIDKLAGAIMHQVGEMMNARLAVIE